MTNREFISKLSNGNLAELIGPRHCPPGTERKTIAGKISRCPYNGAISCHDCWVQWLKKEHTNV